MISVFKYSTEISSEKDISMSSNKDQSRVKALKQAEKEAKLHRKNEKKNFKRELKESKREEKLAAAEKHKHRKSKRSRNSKKYKIKKRFIIFIVIIIAIVAAAGFFGVKGVINLINEDKAAKTAVDKNSPEAVINENEVFDSADPVMLASDIAIDEDDIGKSGDAALSTVMEYRICQAIISDWHISPLTQTKAVIEGMFGELYRYEDWNGGIYYHRGFPETMYITYNGDVKGSQPAADAICDSVSICLKYIIEFEAFQPDPNIWGKVNKTKSDEGWTKYFYSLTIKDGVNLIVYCDKDGNIDQETHIIVRKV